MVRSRWRLRSAVVALALLAFQPPAARAGWMVNSLERLAGVDGAIEYRHYSLGKTDSGTEAEVQLALFSSKGATLRVIDQANSSRSLAEIMTGENFVAGVNGGYFDPDGAPVGLLISGGKTIAPFRKARLLSGVLAAGAGSIEIFRASEFPRKRAWREAVQSGPFLVDRGKSVGGLDDTRAARRTFVFTTTDGRAAIGYCEPVTLARLAEVLTSLAPLKVARALNLDGGSSSAFWCRAKEKTVSISEYKNVRDFVAIALRK
ncbi:MAG TPA: phosphodiester glycosidase family protein [Chthoniobacterales bacterium]